MPSIILAKLVVFLFREDKNVDPHSPAGTAFGFSKPKLQALEIANTSFLLQFATRRFLIGAMSHKYVRITFLHF